MHRGNKAANTEAGKARLFLDDPEFGKESQPYGTSGSTSLSNIEGIGLKAVQGQACQSQTSSYASMPEPLR
jgi:hypothetical protein